MAANAPQSFIATARAISSTLEGSGGGMLRDETRKMTRAGA
jgi:hypothetical protein